MQYFSKNLIFSLVLLSLISISLSVKFRLQAKNVHTQKKSSVLSHIKKDLNKVSSLRHAKKIESLKNFRFKESVLQQGGGEVGNEAPSVKKGWLKFLEFNGVDELDLKFYINPGYNELQKKPYDEETSDEFGSIEIPATNLFWFILNPRGLFALSSRRNELAKTSKFVTIAEIKPILMSKGEMIGGLEDLGNFKEGFCWRIIKSDEQQCILCSDNMAEKAQWISSIKYVKGSQTAFTQPEKRWEGTVSLGPAATLFTNSYKQTGPNGEQIQTQIDKAQKNYDDEWVALQDWSTCTLSCGGGTQTMQRKCEKGTAPDNIRKPCIGEAIMTTPCNTDPCTDTDGKTEEAEILPMKVKQMRVSTRPQRYETCIIKEGDLEIIREDLGNFIRPIRVPARVVLNNQTFSVFQTTNFDTVLFTVELSNLELQKYKDDTACFQVVNIADDKSKDNSVTLCSLPSVQGITMDNNRNEWVHQIGFFKDSCQSPLKQSKQPVDDEIVKLKQIEVEEELKEAKTNEGVCEIDDGKMVKVAGLALDALSKETKYEKLAESEELQREIMVELNSRKKLEELKVADECLARDKRKAEALQKKRTELEDSICAIDDMKDNIKSMVMNNRAKANKKIAIMKKMSGKKNRATEDQIQQQRIKMAKEAMAASKLGDMKLCDPKQPAASKVKYCNKAFDTDPDLNQDCKEPDQFCLMCCENEIGLKYIDQREDCFKQCKVSTKQGDWVWVPESNQVKQQ